MEEQAPFGTFDHELPSYLEKVQSQLPALQLLMQQSLQGILFTADPLPTGLAQEKGNIGQI